MLQPAEIELNWQRRQKSTLMSASKITLATYGESNIWQFKYAVKRIY